jgi:hypothetical protein
MKIRSNVWIMRGKLDASKEKRTSWQLNKSHLCKTSVVCVRDVRDISFMSSNP